MPLIPTHNDSLLPSLARMVLVLAFVSFSLVVSTGGVGGQSVEDDHGNTFDTATTLSLGASEEGSIDPINDIDMFKLDLSDASEPTTVRLYTLPGTSIPSDSCTTVMAIYPQRQR